MSSIRLDPFYASSPSYRRWHVESPPRGASRGRTPSVYAPHTLSSPSRGQYSSPGRVLLSSSSSSPVQSLELELSQAAQISTEFRAVRTEERSQLQNLNDRFAGFIDRVRELEQQNRALEAELTMLRQRHAEPSRLGSLYEQEARALRAAIDDARAEQQAAVGQRERLEQTLSALQGRYEEEVLARGEADGRFMEARREADQATLAKVELEKSVQSVLDELAFLKRVHENELAELQAQVHLGLQVSVESESAAPDLSGALRDIRSQYESLAARNMQAAEEWFRGKVGALTQTVAQHADAMRSSKDEAGEYRRRLQNRLLEIDACRGLNESLEKELHEMEDKNGAEIAALHDTIGDLENELRGTKQEMGRYMKEYQDLLNVKMALDIEIAAYRKLLEGEESRFSVGGVYSHSLSAPSLSRPAFPSYLMTSRLLGSSAAEGLVLARWAPQAEARPPAKEEEEEKEEAGAEETEGDEEQGGEVAQGREDEAKEGEEEEATEAEEGGDEENQKGEETEAADDKGDEKEESEVKEEEEDDEDTSANNKQKGEKGEPKQGDEKQETEDKADAKKEGENKSKSDQEKDEPASEKEEKPEKKGKQSAPEKEEKVSPKKDVKAESKKDEDHKPEERSEDADTKSKK